MWLKKWVEVFSDDTKFNLYFKLGVDESAEYSLYEEQMSKEAIIKNGLFNYIIVLSTEVKDNVVNIYC